MDQAMDRDMMFDLRGQVAFITGAAKGLGNPVFYVGPATGRDGLAGAAFASGPPAA